MGKNINKADLFIKYGVKPSEIDARVLIQSLSSFTDIIEEINKEISKGQKINIRVKATKPGSFILQLTLIAGEIVDFIQGIDIKDISVIIQTMLNVFLLRKHLKGKEPSSVNEEGENVTIENNSGGKITVSKKGLSIYNSNVIINDALNNNFETLKSDSNINSLEIRSSSSSKPVKLNRDEFETMSIRSIEESPDKNMKEIVEVAVLNIVKIVWDKKRKWEFLYRGNKITAQISDITFWNEVVEGDESFHHGDYFEAVLQITQVYDEIAKSYRNISYNIIKINDHIKRSKQGRFPF